MKADKSLIYSWVFMFIAILTEVFGTLSMKFSTENASVIGLIIMYFMLIISYFSLSIAVKRIPLALAYGSWESLGLVLIAIASHFLFKDYLTVTKTIAILFIIAGIFLLEHGTESSH